MSKARGLVGYRPNKRFVVFISMVLGGVVTIASILSLSLVHASGDNGHYLVDFGDVNLPTTTTGWNNVLGTHANDTTTVYSLVDSTGASSPATLRITNGFNCYTSGAPVNTNGTTSSTLYPATATEDSFFLGVTGSGSVCTQNATTASFAIGGLASGATYEVRFYASRMGVTDNRTTDYTIGSTTVSLNAAGNVNGYASIPNVTPTNGTITATVSKSTLSAMYGYLGVVEIIRSTSSPTVNAGADQSITLPTHSVTLSGTATDSAGTITSYAWSETSSNGATIATPNSASTIVTDLAAGTYTFRLTATDNLGATSSSTTNVTVNPNVIGACGAQKVTVIGSSTAAGTGASPVSNSWVNLYSTYLNQLNASNSVVNLAVGGYTTYNEMPTGFVPPAGRPSPDTSANITAAIATNPSAIVVSLPTNDSANGESVAEIESNFQTIVNTATQAGIPVWISTSQPRTNSITQSQRNDLMTLRDWITSTYGANSLDFWTGLANSDGTINASYDSGDGIHPNNAGHQKLYDRIADSSLIGTLCNTPPIVSSVSAAPVISDNITWKTNTVSSSLVEYGTTTNYGTTTPETDISPRVTNHLVTLGNLLRCTLYHYRVHSKDAAGHEQIGTDQTLTTLCN